MVIIILFFFKFASKINYIPILEKIIIFQAQTCFMLYANFNHQTLKVLISILAQIIGTFVSLYDA
jgi:hypothetical protein